MGSTKLFIKKYRDATRLRAGQPGKLGSIGVVGMKVYSFLKGNVKPNTSFSLVVLKCQFFNNEGGRSLTHRLQDMIDAELISVLAAQDASFPGQEKSCGWLRSLLVQHIVDLLTATAPEDVDQTRAALYLNCKDASALLSMEVKENSLQGIITDLLMMKKLFSFGAGDGTKFSEMSAAEYHIMSEPRLALLRGALKDSPSGQEMLAPLAQLKADTINDDLGDQRFSVGLDCFADKTMLRVCRQACTVGASTECPLIVSNGSLVLGSPMLLETMLTDAICNVVESINLWSPARFELKHESLGEFVHVLSATIVAAEFVLLHNLYSQIRVPFLNLLKCNEECFDEMHSMMMAFGVACQNAPQATAAVLLKKLCNLGSTFKVVEELSTLVQGHVATSKKNSIVTRLLRDFLQTISAMSLVGFPSSAEAAIEQWVVQGEASCLAGAVALSENARQLQATKFDFSIIFQDSGGSVELSTDCLQVKVVKDEEDTGGGHEEPHILVEDLLQFPSMVVKLPLVRWASRLVKDSVAALLDKFAVLAELDGVIVAAAKVDCTFVGAMMSRFVLPHRLTSSVSAFTKIIGAGQVELKSRSACDLLESLLSASGLRKVMVGSSLAEVDGEMSTEGILAICDKYVLVHHVAAALAWIGVTCSGPSGCTVECKLKVEVEVALDIIESNLCEARDKLYECENLVPRKTEGPIQLKLSSLACSTWLSTVTDAFPEMCCLVVNGLIASVQHLTKIVQSHTPAYKHFLNDTMCTGKLVKARLINFAHKDALTQESVQLFKCLAEVARFRKKFSITPSSDSEDVHAEVINLARGAFSEAKTVMTLAAASLVVYERTGDEQLREAREWMASKATILPKALLKELQTIVSKSSVKIPAGSAAVG
jgi:hypothetical protein